MITDWKELAERLGLIHNDGESGGDRYAEQALQEILGEEWILQTVEHILSYKKGSEIAMNCLRLIRSKKAATLAYQIYKSSSNDRADRAVWLIKHLEHPIAITWVEEFLDDDNVKHWGLGVLDELLWHELVPYDDYTKALLEKSENVSPEQVQFIREYLAERDLNK